MRKEELLKLSNNLDVEQERHIRENLSEEELVIFDILTRPAPELTTAEREEVKKVAIAKAANMALVATSNELRDQIGNDLEIINRLAVDLARTAKAEIEKRNRRSLLVIAQNLANIS